MSEIEQQFFEIFDIPKIVVSDCYDYYIKGRNIDIYGKHCNEYLNNGGNCVNCTYKQYIEEFPEITDRILLELICILNDFEGIDIKATTVKELKEELLKQAIIPFEYPIAFEEYHEINKLYHQVQTLFKGE